MEDDTLWTNKMELIVGSLAVGFFVGPRRNSICIDSLAGGCDIYSPWGKVCEQLVWENTLFRKKMESMVRSFFHLQDILFKKNCITVIV